MIFSDIWLWSGLGTYLLVTDKTETDYCGAACRGFMHLHLHRKVAITFPAAECHRFHICTGNEIWPRRNLGKGSWMEV